MCFSLPGEVVQMRGPAALVQTAGVRRWCNSLIFPELRVGDRVLLHAGLVVQVLTAQEAREAELAFEALGVLSG
ncbi:MAG: HypC/HybG/HupF family hydrogenase formation chaperone [Solirubrobacteraceae bacterium]